MARNSQTEGVGRARPARHLSATWSDLRPTGTGCSGPSHGSLAGSRGGVLLLSRDGNAAATDAVRAHASAISRGYVLGGEASVSAATLSALEEATS